MERAAVSAARVGCNGVSRGYRRGVGRWWPPVIETWGSTAEERDAAYPCDAWLGPDDAVVFRAIDIDAPTDVVFRWLCQLRVAPYSYDWIDNFGRRSPQQLTEGLDRLEVGQRFVAMFRLVDFEDGHSITIRATMPVFGRVLVTYVVNGAAHGRSRLVVKLAWNGPRVPLGSVTRPVLAAGDLVMMRRQLLNLKALAERDTVARVTA
jgi:hypothetical protein